MYGLVVVSSPEGHVAKNCPFFQTPYFGGWWLRVFDCEDLPQESLMVQ
jgi:hypothetical protein